MGAIHELSFGGVTTRTNLFLSPMSGVTDCAFRSLVRSCSGEAVGLVVSEFVAAEGLSRSNEKTLRMLRYKESERPISIQIFGADPDRMVRAAQLVESAGADIVDINCGCPAPKVVRRGGGAELMRQPLRLRQILRRIRASVSIPMTVKIRAGWDATNQNALPIARIAQEEGAAMVAIHARTRVDLYRGRADWDLVSRLRAALSIPVVGSGDIREARTAVTRMGYADGIMIGRAALDNPWIFAQVQDLASGLPLRYPSLEERVAALQRFRDFLRETLPDHRLLGRFRGFACRFLRGVACGAEARRNIGRAETVEAVESIVTEALLGRDVELLEQVA